MTPSAEERRKCTASSSMWCTCRPSIVTWCELSSTMPFFDVAYGEAGEPPVGRAEKPQAVTGVPARGRVRGTTAPCRRGPSLISTAVRGPVSVIGSAAVPARWVDERAAVLPRREPDRLPG